MRKFLTTLSLVLACIPAFCQKTDKKLQAKLEEAIQGFNGEIGIYVKNLRSGKVASIHADTIFPTASIVKVPIAIGIMDKVSRGLLQYDSLLTYKDSLLYEGEDILGSFKSGEKIMLDKVMMLMLTMSDNTASLWLQSLAGGGIRINALMDSIGLKHTRVNSRTAGRRNDWVNYGWGQTTPKEMGTLFELINGNKLFNAVISDRLKRNLGNNFWDEKGALSQLPPYVQVYSKNGAVNATRSEAILVNAPGNPYIYCIFTKNIKDTGWTRANEAMTMARKTSRIVWKHYQPKDKWEPGTFYNETMLKP